MTFRTIAADPPWPQKMAGQYKRARAGKMAPLPYATMSLDAIRALPVGDYAAVGAHCWLWTTNAFLEAAFGVLRAWGFTYLTTVTWVKPSGVGAWFAGTTQHCLFGYKERCRFEGRRYAPTDFRAVPPRHSEKPPRFYTLAEEVSAPDRLELFARRERPGWTCLGDAIDGTDITAALAALGGARC